MRVPGSGTRVGIHVCAVYSSFSEARRAAVIRECVEYVKHWIFGPSVSDIYYMVAAERGCGPHCGLHDADAY